MILRLEIEIVVSKGMSLFALISIFFSWMYVFFFAIAFRTKLLLPVERLNSYKRLKKKKKKNRYFSQYIFQNNYRRISSSIFFRLLWNRFSWYLFWTRIMLNISYDVISFKRTSYIHDLLPLLQGSHQY